MFLFVIGIILDKFPKDDIKRDEEEALQQAVV
jgi:hypothetical protein